MIALKEFANFITHNKATLAATYARLLAESGSGYENFTPESRLASGRKLLNGVVAACQADSFTPLLNLFVDDDQTGSPRWGGNPMTPPQPMLEIECLGHTLTPVVTNLDAGKFLWRMLADLRRQILNAQTLAPPTMVELKSISLSPEEKAIHLDEKLVKERELLQILLNNLPDYIYIKDTKSRFLLANTATLDHLGAASPDEVIGKTDFDFSPPELAEQYYAAERELLQTGRSLIGHEEPILDHKTGRQKWVLTTKVPFRDSQGNIAGLVGLNRDITELKKAHEILEREHKQIEALAKQLDDIRFALDQHAIVAITDQKGIIHYVNDKFCEISKFSREELLGQDHWIINSGYHPKEFIRDLWVTIASGKVWKGEIKNKAKDGTIFWVDTTLVPILDEQGKPLQYIAVRTDITQTKEYLTEIERRAAELETVAQVSHAVLTILNPDELLQSVADLTKERFKLYHAHIYLLDNASNMLNLAAGAGQIGRQMVAQGWRIPFDQEASIVARAARHQRAIIVNNVKNSTGFFPNPLLPDTQAEMAVPLMVGNRVLGVLDVQADQTDYFTKHDVSIQTTLAGQIAIALENARLIQDAQQRAYREQTIREITDRLRSAPNLERLVAIAAEGLGQHLSASYAELELGILAGSNEHSTSVDETGANAG